MTGVKLSKRKKVLLFNYFSEFVAGITTKNLGDMKLFRKNGILSSLNQLIGIKPFVIIKPEHSDRVVTITECPIFAEYIRYECDAIIYNGEKTFAPVLMSMTGDCPIVVFVAELVDDKNKIIMGIVHSGWRGTALNIVSKTIKEIIKINGQNIKAIVWPGICEKCYEVGDDLQKQFPSRYFNNSKLNLQACIEDQLQEHQINYYVIEGFCPHCKGEKFFFSHRSGFLERNGVFIAPKF